MAGPAKLWISSLSPFSFPLDQLIDLRAEQCLAVASLQRLDPIARADIPVLHRDLIGRAVNHESQIVGLAADHQIKWINRGAKARSVVVPWEWIRVDDRVLPIASHKMVEIVAGSARHCVVAGATDKLVHPLPS